MEPASSFNMLKEMSFHSLNNFHPHWNYFLALEKDLEAVSRYISKVPLHRLGCFRLYACFSLRFFTKRTNYICSVRHGYIGLTRTGYQ